MKSFSSILKTGHCKVIITPTFTYLTIAHELLIGLNCKTVFFIKTAQIETFKDVLLFHLETKLYTTFAELNLGGLLKQHILNDTKPLLKVKRINLY